MIRFFSKIRRVQLQESKVGRYVLYAIGEIFLVVIGILIALQVNNWNEARKTHAFELVILQEIRENVRLNLERFRASERRLQTSDAGIHLYLEESAKPEPDRARLEQYLEVARTSMLFTYNSGAYDSLKAGGLDRLSNRALRTKLIQYFDSFLPRYSNFFEVALEYKQLNDNVKYILEPVIVRDRKGLQRVEMRLPAKFNPSSREVLDILARNAMSNQSASFRFKTVYDQTEDLLLSLDAEIENNATVKPKPTPSARKSTPKRDGSP